jgi:hypothetical protein
MDREPWITPVSGAFIAKIVNAGRGGLNEWQLMFQEIYPRESDDRWRSTIGLFEELGELAEAIRVFDKYPMYFLGEAADIFSYLMA